MPELLLCCALLCRHCRLICSLLCCFLLLQLRLLLKHLRSAAFSPFFTEFCHFRIFHTWLSAIFHISLSPFILHKLMRFLISPTWWSLWSKRAYFYCLLLFRLFFLFFLNYYTSTLSVLHKCRNFFSVAHFCAAIVVFSGRFGAAFCCFNFAFCWSTYFRPLSLFWSRLKDFLDHTLIGKLKYNWKRRVFFLTRSEHWKNMKVRRRFADLQHRQFKKPASDSESATIIRMCACVRDVSMTGAHALIAVLNALR